MIVIVLGMHRSGTSALAGLLHSNGVVMGNEEKKDFYPPPMKENPKGFYENVRFRRINDALLKKVGYSVKSFDPIIQPVPVVEKDDPLRDKMVELITEFNENHYWGWKDPRTNLTIASWVAVMRDMEIPDSEIKFVYIDRIPGEISVSMINRGNKEKYGGQFKDLAEAYRSRFFDTITTIDTNIFSMIVDFKNLLFEAEDTVAGISHFIRKELPDLSFIDPQIPKNEGTI